jgi:hypothetical protein
VVLAVLAGEVDVGVEVQPGAVEQLERGRRADDARAVDPRGDGRDQRRDREIVEAIEQGADVHACQGQGDLQAQVFEKLHQPISLYGVAIEEDVTGKDPVDPPPVAQASEAAQVRLPPVVEVDDDEEVLDTEGRALAFQQAQRVAAEVPGRRDEGHEQPVGRSGAE